MENKKTPKYLYHYTSLQSLALILQSHKIRFNPLSNMDDLQEKRAKESKDYGRFFFVSSWTSEKKESIPMWNMYTKMEEGVRIRLPINPFVPDVNMSELHKKYNIEDNGENIDIPNMYFDIFKFLGMGILPSVIKTEDLNAFPVKYTNDIKALEPEAIVSDGNSCTYATLGLCKNKYWKFQKEWRYVIQFHSFASPENIISLDINKIVLERDKWQQKTLDGSVTLPFSCWLLPIEDKCFAKMQITKSPQMSKGNEILLDTLVEKYNPTAKILDSKLKDLI